MKAVPSQPSRHRWHLSLVKESALLFYKESFHGVNDRSFTFALYSHKLWHNHREKITQNDFLK